MRVCVWKVCRYALPFFLYPTPSSPPLLFARLATKLFLIYFTTSSQKQFAGNRKSSVLTKPRLSKCQVGLPSEKTCVFFCKWRSEHSTNTLVELWSTLSSVSLFCLSPIPPPVLALVNTPIGHSVRIYENEGFQRIQGSLESPNCVRENWRIGVKVESVCLALASAPIGKETLLFSNPCGCS